MIFIQQLLTSQGKVELLWEFIEFLFFLIIILTDMLSAAGITILMLKTQITQTNILYVKTKGELRFYFCSLLYVVFFLVISFFALNFHNMNYLYLINILEIFIFFIICILYMYVNTFKKPTTDKEILAVNKEEKLQMFIAPIVLMLISIVLFFSKGFIFNLLNNYI
jgi:heme O synthase-like polyprenyltransferase